MSISALKDIPNCTVSLTTGAGLSASGNRVTAWADQSGNGNNPTIVSAPFYNGSGRVNFGFLDPSTTGIQKTWIDLPAGFHIDRQALTIVIIGTMNGIGPIGNGGLIFAFTDAILYCQIHGNQLEFPGFTLGAFTEIPSGPMVFIVRLSASAAKAQINEFTLTAAALSAGTSDGTCSFGNYAGGADQSYSPYAWDQMAMFSRAITDAEVNSIFAYAQANYPGIELAPTGRLVVDGDSIGYGLYGNGVGTGYSVLNNGWASLLTVPAGAEKMNIAIGGQTMETQAANASTRVVPLASGITDFAVISAGGSNDLTSGKTGAELFAFQQSYGNTVKGSTSAKVALCTILPRAGIETQRQANRALLLADFNVATAHPRIWLAGLGVTYGDVLIDVGNNPTIGQSGDQNNTTYYEDGTHPTAQGHVIYAADAQDAISYLIPSPAPSGNALLSAGFW